MSLTEREPCELPSVRETVDVQGRMVAIRWEGGLPVAIAENSQCCVRFRSDDCGNASNFPDVPASRLANPLLLHHREMRSDRCPRYGSAPSICHYFLSSCFDLNFFKP